MIMRVVLSLAAVFGLLWFFQRKMARSAGVQDRRITVVAKQGITPKAAVVTVDTEGRRFVLGVTEASVNVIFETAVPEQPSAAPETPAKGGSQSWEAVSGSILDPNAWKQLSGSRRHRRRH
ncbi:MAG: flagellar biosynthetic protein FliO [Arthrobacter sp.]